jgi:hypothetical protein
VITSLTAFITCFANIVVCARLVGEIPKVAENSMPCRLLAPIASILASWSTRPEAITMGATTTTNQHPPKPGTYDYDAISAREFQEESHAKDYPVLVV